MDVFKVVPLKTSPEPGGTKGMQKGSPTGEGDFAGSLSSCREGGEAAVPLMMSDKFSGDGAWGSETQSGSERIAQAPFTDTNQDGTAEEVLRQKLLLQAFGLPRGSEEESVRGLPDRSMYHLRISLLGNGSRKEIHEEEHADGSDSIGSALDSLRGAQGNERSGGGADAVPSDPVQDEARSLCTEAFVFNACATVISGDPAEKVKDRSWGSEIAEVPSKAMGKAEATTIPSVVPSGADEESPSEWMKTVGAEKAVSPGLAETEISRVLPKMAQDIGRTESPISALQTGAAEDFLPDAMETAAPEVEVSPVALSPASPSSEMARIPLGSLQDMDRATETTFSPKADGLSASSGFQPADTGGVAPESPKPAGWASDLTAGQSVPGEDVGRKPFLAAEEGHPSQTEESMVEDLEARRVASGEGLPERVTGSSRQFQERDRTAGPVFSPRGDNGAARDRALSGPAGISRQQDVKSSEMGPEKASNLVSSRSGQLPTPSGEGTDRGQDASVPADGFFPPLPEGRTGVGSEKMWSPEVQGKETGVSFSEAAEEGKSRLSGDLRAGEAGGTAPSPLEQPALQTRFGEILLQSRGAEAMARGLAETIHVIRRREGHRGTVEVSPPELGRVRITVDSSGEAVQVHLRVDSAQVRDMLQQTSDVLREALERQGLNLTEMSVDVGQQGKGQGSAGGGAPQEGAGSGSYPALSDSTDMDEEEVMTRLDLERGILNWVA